MWETIIYEGYIFHLICGFFISFIMGLMWRPWIILGFIAGVAKEVFDFYDYGRFDEADMYITWVGAMAGTIAVLMMYKKVKRYMKYARC